VVEDGYWQVAGVPGCMLSLTKIEVAAMTVDEK